MCIRNGKQTPEVTSLSYMYLRDCGYPLVSVLDRDTVGAISVEILLLKLLYLFCCA